MTHPHCRGTQWHTLTVEAHNDTPRTHRLYSQEAGHLPILFHLNARASPSANPKNTSDTVFWSTNNWCTVSFSCGCETCVIVTRGLPLQREGHSLTHMYINTQCHCVLWCCWCLLSVVEDYRPDWGLGSLYQMCSLTHQALVRLPACISSVILLVCPSVCLSQDLTRGTSCFISIVVLTHPVLKHLRLWACGCESVSLCASTVRVCHCVPLQWGCVIVCLYSEGVSLCASTVRVCHCVPLQWGCVIVCLYSESVSLCASTVRVWHCVPLQWGYVIVCLYSESVSLCASTVRVCHCVPLQWGCVIVCLYSEGVTVGYCVRLWQCDGVLDHVCRCWRALKNLTSHFNMKGSSKLPSPFNII